MKHRDGQIGKKGAQRDGWAHDPNYEIPLMNFAQTMHTQVNIIDVKIM